MLLPAAAGRTCVYTPVIDPAEVARREAEEAQAIADIERCAAEDIVLAGRVLATALELDRERTARITFDASGPVEFDGEGSGLVSATYHPGSKPLSIPIAFDRQLQFRDWASSKLDEPKSRRTLGFRSVVDVTRGSQ